MIAKKEILDLIAQGETRKALDSLLGIGQLMGEDLMHEVTIQSGKFEQLKKDERNGVKSAEQLEVRLSRINAALIEIIRKIPNNAGESAENPAIKKRSQRTVRMVLLVLVLATTVGLGWKMQSNWSGLVERPEPDTPLDSMANKTDKEPAVPGPNVQTPKDAPQSVRSRPELTSLKDPLDKSPDHHATKDSVMTDASQVLFDTKMQPIEGMTRIIKNGAQSFLNEKGVWIGTWYEDAEDFHNGRAFVKKNGRYFYIDKTGQCVKGCE